MIMKINDKLEVVEADSFSTSTAYRMTLKYEGETFYYRGETHEYGMDSYWYNSEGNKIADPDWADLIEESEDKTLFDICEEKIEEEKKKSGRTECGFEVEQALVKELELQGFPSDLIRQVLRTYPIDQIIFESILKEASIKIDELQKAEVK
jgi:hypothetical protein